MGRKREKEGERERERSKDSAVRRGEKRLAYIREVGAKRAGKGINAARAHASSSCKQ